MLTYVVYLFWTSVHNLIDYPNKSILGIVLNGDITKEVDTQNRDVEMADKDVDMDSISVNKVSLEAASESKQDISMEDKDVEMESRDELTNSAMDDDSQDSQGSQTRFVLPL